MSDRQIRPEIFAALREGGRLCPACLGAGVLRGTSTPDFVGDKEYQVTWICVECKGTGLELTAEEWDRQAVKATCRKD